LNLLNALSSDSFSLSLISAIYLPSHLPLGMGNLHIIADSIIQYAINKVNRKVEI
jgi:hypothetical protein